MADLKSAYQDLKRFQTEYNYRMPIRSTHDTLVKAVLDEVEKYLTSRQAVPHELRGYRKSDPQTSKDAAKAVRITAENQRGKILRSYSRFGPMTDEGAALVTAGVRMDSCYWKRCSELRNEGYIAPVYEDGVLVTARGTSGVNRMVCEITPKGRYKVEEIS